MVIVGLVFLISFAGLIAAIVVPELSDLVLLAGPAAMASGFLIWRHSRPKRPSGQGMVVVDGSNVMHWRDNQPNLEALRDVIRALSARGLTAGVMFDANAGYLLAGRYLNDAAFGRMLNLPVDRVMVVPKGAPADPSLLLAARDYGARVVSNDRFRDWAEDFPEVNSKGHLIRGGYRSGVFWLDLE